MKTKILILMILALAILPATSSFAGYSDMKIVSGNVSVTTDAQTGAKNFTASDKAIVEFNKFNVGSNEIFNIIQPSANASALFRVTGSDQTVIAGTLTANGILFLINPNGINFAPTANVQVNTLVASTLDIANNNFINGNYELMRQEGSNYSKIVNEAGVLEGSQFHGTNIALIGSSVENKGIIVAQSGTIHLVSGDKTVVAFDQRGLINVEVTEATSGKVIDKDGNTIKDAIANSGTLQAHQVFMTAKTAQGMFEHAVNNTGIVMATKLESGEGGIIKIVADHDIQVSGRLEAVGGAIDIETPTTICIKNRLKLVGDATMKAGQDINIGADIDSSGGGLWLEAMRIIVSNNSTISAESLNLKAGEMDNVVTNAPELSIYQTGPVINLTASYPTDDNHFTLEGDNLSITYLKTSNVTLKGDDLIDTTNAIIINANTLTLMANRFGSYDNPLNVNTANLNIHRLHGDIDIVTSTGIGTSILITGPPADGFGAILYNKDTNLTLEATSGSIYTDNGSTIEAANLSLIAYQNIGLDTNHVYFKADSLSTITAQTGSIYIDSKDTAVHITGDISAYGDVNVYSGAGDMTTDRYLTIRSNTGSINLEATEGNLSIH